MTDLITAARAFAEAAHTGQTRKGAAREPYVVHLEEVAGYVAGHSGSDVAVAAAWLHDTVEDCGVTPDEIAARFGPEVAAVVVELTDDKARPKAERKRLQEVNAPGKSADAALVKACDKLSNLRALVESPPVHWDRARRHAYVDWAERVVAALPAAADPVRPALAAAVARARAALC